ncbi:MAG TPA: HEAT repeat domain-containing protein, partial [Polyangiaceae bacterium]
MIQLLRRIRPAAVAAVCFMAEPLAWAGGDSTANAIRELSNDDFRVRTQAALALGSTKDAKVVQPLCSALSDPKSAVRAAAAAALGKLALGGEDCLSEREAKEQSDSVKAAIQKALVAVR